uniref:Uncharacterized protein n=1 Tax=Odontella aurita TaxID=265563 RepID=A0A7S4MSS6_9STRA|mmetsp:Transcript_3094/g.8070  ORF Transcript_3094/g.8070 Transcript_3094/m.8070 type:complete len:286 (+) Transcript_3094:333-1190(+)
MGLQIMPDSDKLVRTKSIRLGADVEAAAEAASFEELSKEHRVIIRKLSTRDYHLPGNSYWPDYVQFISNNHPLLSFCYAHPLHPFSIRDRIFCLVGSLTFGLGATCAVWLYFYFRGLSTVDIGPLALSEPVVGLVASVLNAGFDMCIWYMQMCPCCRTGACFHFDDRFCAKYWVWMGQNLAGVIVIISACLALAAVILRAQINDEQGQEGPESFSFLRSWGIEVTFSLLLVFPLMATTLFSGILGCFRLPVLGGRPWEVWREKKLEENHHCYHNGDQLSATQASF